VQSSIQAGARLILGGAKDERPGYFYPATVLADVRPGMAAFDKETFGPVAALTIASDAQQAVELANNSDYGLGGALWTSDLKLARRLAGEVETGGFFVNGFSASDPRIPIGGVKKSGYGRELSTYGVHEFMNIQTVWFDRK
jgi:succinate-semialdehyde dehydrogenase